MKTEFADNDSWFGLLFWPMVFWTAVLVGSYWWNLSEFDSSSLKLANDRGRAVFNIIETQRLWNARHGGVYVPVTKDNPPNPYLIDPMRDLTTTEGVRLTKINPSYMTRQISEITSEEGLVAFHMTSLFPLRPENRADEWETEALMEFERGSREKLELFETGSGMVYRYIAPLFVEESCLKCHAEQGYTVGDIRGGIGVSFSAAPFIEARKKQKLELLLLHLGVFLVGMFLIARVIAERRKRDEVLYLLSMQDGLTGIANRHHFDDVYETEWRRAVRDRAPLSVIMIDIDFFKQFNDTYGHLAGDDCLRAVARSLRDSVMRPADLVARYGGEEFVVLLPSTALESAVKLAEAMRGKVQESNIPHSSSSVAGCVTISAGVASATPAPGSDAASLVEQADEALYRAKQEGRNRVRY